jgi:hypothetical protein
MTRDQNGNLITRNVRKAKTPAGKPAWAVNVWWGGAYGPATNLRVYFYRQREDARRGDISDDIGKHGRIA